MNVRDHFDQKQLHAYDILTQYVNTAQNKFECTKIYTVQRLQDYKKNLHRSPGLVLALTFVFITFYSEGSRVQYFVDLKKKLIR